MPSNHGLFVYGDNVSANSTNSQSNYGMLAQGHNISANGVIPQPNYGMFVQGAYVSTGDVTFTLWSDIDQYSLSAQLSSMGKSKPEDINCWHCRE